MDQLLHQETPDYQDYLKDALSSGLDTEKILATRSRHLARKKTATDKESYEKALALAATLPHRELSVSHGAVGEFHTPLMPSSQRETVVGAFIPWRVGPWWFDGTLIDSEWRCDVRWGRIVNHSGSLFSKAKVADVGCNNGYFMFRTLEKNPDLVVGFEPVIKHYYGFHLFQNIYKARRLHFEPFGFQQLEMYPQFFDVILCLGVLYHHPNPMEILELARAALAPQGKLIIECQGIDGGEPVALMPKSRYGGCKGYWWLPTVSCLQNWIQRAGFSQSCVFHNEFLDQGEQRKTSFAPYHSLEDQLNPTDPAQTIEGYPAPKRFYLMVSK